MDVFKQINKIVILTALMVALETHAEDIDLYVDFDKDLTEKERVIFVLDTSGSMMQSANTGTKCFHPTLGNWIACPDSRMEVAKQTIINTINKNPDIDYGFVRFAPSQGGYFRGKLGTDHTILKALITETYAGGSTPLAETLWEIYLYLTGQNVDFGKAVDPLLRDLTAERGNKYISPLDSSITKDARCNNLVNIIMITDGSPQNDNDRDSKIEELHQSYFSEKAKTWLDDSGRPNYLAALAKIMHGTEDAKTDIYPKTSKIVDEVVLNTIGFGNGLTERGDTILREAANAGGGSYILATNPEKLAEALEQRFDALRTEAGSFVAPSIASNNADQTRSRDSLYYTMFYPSTSARWRGNLKKLKVSGDVIVDAKGNLGLADNGQINEDAYTFWSQGGKPDGNAVELGGVNLYLSNQSSVPNKDRKVLTNVSGGQMLPFTAYRVIFHYGNKYNAAVAFESEPDEVFDLIDWSRGRDVDDQNEDGSTEDTREDIFGDPLHSKPVTIDYGNDDVRILVGTNAGYLHMFQDKNDVLKESWAFIPRSLYKIIKPLRDRKEATKVYGVDGPISIFFDDKNSNGVVDINSDRVWVFFGLRRGGNEYYALDITNPDSPKLMWGGPLVGGSGDFEELAQTWSKPLVTYINLKGYKDRPLLVFGAGYDTNKDNSTRSNDSKGRGIFIVDAETGKKVWALTPTENGFLGQHSIASDISLLDSDYDGYIDRLYATDTGGDVWRIDMPTDNPKNSQQPWTHFKLASLGSSFASQDRRFFYKSTIARSVFSKVSKTKTNGEEITSRIDTPFDAVIIGSGNRANPLSKNVNDQLFMIRDINTVTQSFKGTNIPKTIYQSDLMNVDSDPFGAVLNDVNKFTNLEVELAKFNGWYYNLPATGEKSLAASTVIGGVAYFTSYIPPSASDSGNECSVGSGEGGLYAFHLHYGTKIYDELKFTTGTDVPDTPQLYFGETDSCSDINSDGYCDGTTDEVEKISQFMTVGPEIIGQESPFKVKGVLGPGLTIENGEVKLVSDEPLGFKVQQTYIYKEEKNDRSN